MQKRIIIVLIIYFSIVVSSCSNSDRGVKDNASAPAPQNVSPQTLQDSTDDRKHEEIHGSDSLKKDTANK
jgi:hypothetical protein